jgi:Domain of unknown function (DUF4265)
LVLADTLSKFTMMITTKLRYLILLPETRWLNLSRASMSLLSIRRKESDSLIQDRAPAHRRGGLVATSRGGRVASRGPRWRNGTYAITRTHASTSYRPREVFCSMNQTVLRTFVELHKKTGKPFFENLLVEPLSDGRFRLLRSPGFLQGFAAEDLLSFDPVSGVARLLEHGPNLCVQCFRPQRALEFAEYLEAQIKAWSGRVDGIYKDTLLVLTIPVGVGIPTIEHTLTQAAALFHGSSWHFANVYDPHDGKTPYGSGTP